jgi:GntR family L-lactate dehydrogenase operon transcriptional regulator
METRLADREQIVLEMIRQSPQPLGAWNLAELLAQKGVNVGASTVGRMLNHLETLGYLSKKNCNQGRTITAKGKTLLDRIERERMLRPISEQLGEVINTNVLGKYLMVLEARKVIERATVRLAARNISEEELRELGRIVARREESLRKGESIAPHDIAFHGLIAAASRNEVLSLLYQTIATQGQQSQRFELIRRRVGGPSLKSHREILNALQQRDANLAEQRITQHIDALISDLQKYWHEFLE